MYQQMELLGSISEHRINYRYSLFAKVLHYVGVAVNLCEFILTLIILSIYWSTESNIKIKTWFIVFLFIFLLTQFYEYVLLKILTDALKIVLITFLILFYFLWLQIGLMWEH